MEQLTNNMRSLDMWSRVMKTNAGFQSKGLLEMNFGLPESIEKAEIPKIKIIEITVLIKYEVSKPAAGFKFHQFESEGKQRTCVYNDNKVSIFLSALIDRLFKVRIYQILASLFG